MILNPAFGTLQKESLRLSTGRQRVLQHEKTSQREERSHFFSIINIQRPLSYAAVSGLALWTEKDGKPIMRAVRKPVLSLPSHSCDCSSSLSGLRSCYAFFFFSFVTFSFDVGLA